MVKHLTHILKLNLSRHIPSSAYCAVHTRTVRCYTSRALTEVDAEDARKQRKDRLRLTRIFQSKMVWKKGDWLPLPDSAKQDIGKVKDVHKKDMKIKVDDTELSVAYREAKPANPKLDVLLLHGMKFKSQTWVEKPLFTLQILCNLGYRAVAIDLPGFGDSPKPAIKVDPASYVETVIGELGLVAPVIVSPSMSGSYSLPYLFKRPGEVSSRCRGFVPVAPVHTEAYTADMYKALNVPCLIVYGEKDSTPIGPVSLKNLKNLQNHVVDIFEGGSHPCYLDDPDRFHSHVHTFLSSLL